MLLENIPAGWPQWLLRLVESVGSIPAMTKGGRAVFLKKHGRGLPVPVCTILAPKSPPYPLPLPSPSIPLHGSEIIY
ncbi:MAG TPA: hypothetical protein VHM91_11090 [Verrucomicrobiales bacterium]|nr:hypothetical protein [Verrucomicrobiales bacterium]